MTTTAADFAPDSALAGALTAHLAECTGQRLPIALRAITVIAGSPAAPTIRTLVGAGDALLRSRVCITLLLAQLQPPAEMLELARLVERLHPGALTAAHLRHIADPRLWEAHEQVVFGTGRCWSGDALRREPGPRGLSLASARAEDRLRAQCAFATLWNRARLVPLSALADRGSDMRSGAEAGSAAAVAAAARNAAADGVRRH